MIPFTSNKWHGTFKMGNTTTTKKETLFSDLKLAYKKIYINIEKRRESKLTQSQCTENDILALVRRFRHEIYYLEMKNLKIKLFSAKNKIIFKFIVCMINISEFDFQNEQK